MVQERRVISGAASELRLLDGDQPRLAGYAIVFNSESELMFDMIEIVRSSFVDRTLNGGDEVVGRIEHQGGLMTIGRRSSGTLRLSKDERGLRYEVDLPDTTAARDLRVLVERGDISGSSFAFTVAEDGDRWTLREDGIFFRELLDGEIHDVAPVTSPAYVDTTVAVRGLTEQKERQPSVGHRARLARKRYLATWGLRTT